MKVRKNNKKRFFPFSPTGKGSTKRRIRELIRPSGTFYHKGRKNPIIIEPHSKLRNIPSQQKIHQWIIETLGKTPCEEITIRIVNKKESAFFNETYRKKKGPTDVLSFGYQINPLWGDIILCAVLIKDEKTWAHLIVHSTLHLMGYDHITSHDAKRMESIEIKILKKLNFENPYII